MLRNHRSKIILDKKISSFFLTNSTDDDFVRIFILIREPGYRFELLCFDVRACETNGGRKDAEEGREGPCTMGRP